MPSNNERIPETLDYQETDERAQDQQLGAKVLSQIHFESSHQPIVESSFNKAIKHGEKLPGKNGERRNLSYLNRLNKLIEKHGNKAEQRLWQASIRDDLLIAYDNIPESYWNAKKQELRDNGYGNYELTEEYKHEIYEKERELQKESLEKWANYLGDERSPYPLWFKVYAWDGMTKMGRYNKGKGKYETRNETTIAPYPDPDAEVLAGVFDVINRYYGNNEKQFYTDEGERNIKLEQIVSSGSFPKVFNAIQQDIAPILEPPEKTEDAHGEWIEYQLGDEDDIARAAKGTGWCVASSSVGRHYLEYGTYGDDGNEDYDDYDNYDEDYENDNNSRQNRSKFILFHLIDEKTGKLSKNACASIRLDPDGNVAEISGLKEGQALDDSLVPIVEEKVKSLPGGEKFLEAFTDKNMLIALDRKMQKGEDLTKEELEFLYEIHRPIQTLDTYNNCDPRIHELKQKYDFDYALDAGISINSFVSSMSPWDIVHNLDLLISHGANINTLVSELKPFDRAVNLDLLISHGADINIDTLVSKLSPDDLMFNLDTLISHDANIDIDALVSKLHPIDIIYNLDTLMSHGADIKLLIFKLHPSDIANNLDTLISHGAKINIKQLVLEQLHPSDIAKNLDTLISHGLDIDDIVSNLSQIGATKNLLEAIISHGANVDDIVSNMSSAGIANNLDTLISYGANIDDIIISLSSADTIKNLDALISHGANIDDLVSNLFPDDIIKNLSTLISHGADIDQLVSEIRPEEIAKYRDVLRRHGANV